MCDLRLEEEGVVVWIVWTPRSSNRSCRKAMQWTTNMPSKPAFASVVTVAMLDYDLQGNGLVVHVLHCTPELDNVAPNPPILCLTTRRQYMPLQPPSTYVNPRRL